jgi:multidrug efflux pump subunit AcrA (membrane-fusion protein)
VTLTLQSASDRTWSGTLDYVAPALDHDSRTLPVRLALPNEDGSLRPGLFGTLSITPAASGREPAPAVESDAVIRIDDREVVFVLGEEPGEFHAVPVTTGARGGGLVEIREGLSAGDRYVADGAFVLKSELSRSQLGHGHAH